ncbi:acyltransferase family protein [Stutzerimonas marianensis]
MFKYKPEVDGLRAIAVLSVVLFHAGFSSFEGGFVGVDVFFVISGYLIASTITAEVDAGKFSFGKFYERRVRRLLPPLIPVLVLSVIAAFMLFSEKQFVDTVHSLLASIGLSSNWYFLYSVGYFDGPGEYTPLLHMWSLSIEEQFYLFFPFLLVSLSGKKGPSAKVVFLFVLVASFLFSSYLLATRPADVAFFNSFGRFWELLIGVCLALWRLDDCKNRAVCNALEVCGLTAIGFSVFAYSPETPFPGPAALVPVLGTAMIIAAGGRGNLVSPILSCRPVLWIGLISYGLYLWHWPIFVFARTIDPMAGPPLMAALSILAVLLAAFSYYFIEGPIRGRKALASRSSLFKVGASSFGVTAAIGLTLITPQALAQRAEASSALAVIMYGDQKSDAAALIKKEKVHYLTKLNTNYNGKSSGFDIAAHDGYTCSYDHGNTTANLLDCLAGQSGPENVLVMGDSIGRDTWHALRRAYPSVSFLMLHQSSCPPGDFHKPGREEGCFRHSAELLRELFDRVEIKGVLLNFRYRPKDWAHVEPGIQAVLDHTKNVAMLGVTPVFTHTVDEYLLAQSGGASLPLYVSKGEKKMVPWDYAELGHKSKTMAEQYGINYVDVHPFFCSSSHCRLWVDSSYSKPLFWDNQHLTDAGIDEYSRFLRAQPVIDRIVRR